MLNKHALIYVKVQIVLHSLTDMPAIFFFFFLLCIPTVAGGKSYAHETELQMQPYFTCHRKQNIHLFHSELMVKHFVANEWCLIALLAGGCLQILIA